MRIVFAILVISVISIAALSLTDPEITRHFIGSGGESSSSSFILKGSLGQHDAGGILIGGEYKLSGGFWGASSVSLARVHLPLILR